jgi:hypothetical protein
VTWTSWLRTSEFEVFFMQLFGDHSYGIVVLHIGFFSSLTFIVSDLYSSIQVFQCDYYVMDPFTPHDSAITT